jgi:hypothetical protein
MDVSTFTGGLGIGGVAGSAVTNWINRWREGRSERTRWLQDRDMLRTPHSPRSSCR